MKSEDAGRPVAVGSSEGLGGSVNEGTDTTGPRGTYGCACLDRDARECMRMRYGFIGYSSERCECLCHQWDDDE